MAQARCKSHYDKHINSQPHRKTGFLIYGRTLYLYVQQTFGQNVSESEDNLFSDSKKIIMEIEETRHKKTIDVVFTRYFQS
jgi:CRISPR/Cas system-associated exonuclease Cas4 (RecB family)